MSKYGWTFKTLCQVKEATHEGRHNTVSPQHMNLQVVDFQRCKHACQSLYASCWTVLLYFSRYYIVRLKMFYFLFVFLCMHYLCEKCYKPVTVQYHTADCVRCVPRLTPLDFWTSSQNGTRRYTVDFWYMIPFTQNVQKWQIRVRKQVGRCLGQGSLGGKGQWLIMGMG